MLEHCEVLQYINSFLNTEVAVKRYFEHLFESLFVVLSFAE